MPAGNSHSIEASSNKAARDGETLFWGSLCSDDPVSALDYCDPDILIINPLLHPDHTLDALTSDSSPTLTDALERLARSKHRWTSYKIHSREPRLAFAQPAMMAVQVMYRVTLIRERHHRHSKKEGGGEGEVEMETVEAFCCGSWRQGSSGGWKMCAQQVVPIAQ